MTALNNTCEGTSGAALPANNIGAPNAFTDSQVSGGATATFDNAHFHAGATAIKLFSPNGVSSNTYVEWQAQPQATDAYYRTYIYLTAAPTFSAGIFRPQGSGATRCSLAIDATTGKIHLFNNVGSSVGVSTAALPTNAWARVELDVTGITGSTGNLAARIYSGANLETLTPDSGGTLSFTGVTVGGSVDGVRIGQTGGTPGADFSYWFDDVAYNDRDQPGPAGSVPVSAKSAGSTQATAAGGTAVYGKIFATATFTIAIG